MMILNLRFVVGVGAGCLTAVTIALVATFVARILWPEYAAAEPEKSYTLLMLFTRLIVGALSTAGAACVATTITTGNRTVAWWLGGLFLAISLPDHLYYVWNDYPAWYHLVYLVYLVPVAGLTGHVVHRHIANKSTPKSC